MYAFECLDCSLRDIMKVVDPKKYNMPFGGITVVLGGDFRQILPVINSGSRDDVVPATITRSRQWLTAKIMILYRNTRLNQSVIPEEVLSLKLFAEWVLRIRNGVIEAPKGSSFDYGEDEIVIPPDFCDSEIKNSIKNMIEWTYPNPLSHYRTSNWSSQLFIVQSIPGEDFTYYSVDRAEEFGGTPSELSFAFPPEYLNSVNLPGLPPHELKLKVGVCVMLMRNLNQILGLCNDTRMMITRCLSHGVECEVICGAFIGMKHFIPRKELCPTDTKLPFKLIRKQMPLQLCYSMTINKSHGQSLERVGLYLPNSVFTHGQFYVAVSRVTSPSGLKVFIDSRSGESTNVTRNVVYKEVFYNLPQ
ncbi:uncharacterized protein LOC141714198 [Apium graveolens]|uniref:uncharacterized protein LOC141714198 n=1 Tax=Apium graveolens TaxID=4045 RepID=UPI003D7BA562